MKAYRRDGLPVFDCPLFFAYNISTLCMQIVYAILRSAGMAPEWVLKQRHAALVPGELTLCWVLICVTWVQRTTLPRRLKWRCLRLEQSAWYVSWMRVVTSLHAGAWLLVERDDAPPYHPDVRWRTDNTDRDRQTENASVLGCMCYTRSMGVKEIPLLESRIWRSWHGILPSE